MDFNQVRYFLALAETLHFTRAAEACHVTQPTLTQAIKRLEDELGGQLVHREGRFTRLTALGQTLRSHFETIDTTRRALKDSARTLTSGESAEIHIGLMCTIGPRLLSGFLSAFRNENPGASLFLHDIAPDMIPELLLSGAIDGAFCAWHTDRHERLDYLHLFDEAMVVAFPDGHVFADLTEVPLSNIAEERYIDRLHCEFRQDLMAFSAEQRIELDVAFTSQREDWIQNMVRDGVGVSIIPEYSLIAPMLACRPVCDPALRRHVEFATVHGGGKSPALRALIRMVGGYRWIPQSGDGPSVSAGSGAFP